MDQSVFEKMLKMLKSESDSDAVMALRAVQNMLHEDGLDLGRIIQFGIQNAEQLKPAPGTIDQKASTPAVKNNAPVEVSGMPQCRAPSAGCIEIIPPGGTSGAVVTLPGVAAKHEKDIASNLKDALVAAVINKSRFKLKLLDVKNGRGEILETALQAEYEREGMTPIRVWVNVRGEVASLATVLRKAVANSMPELVAA